MLYHEDLPPPLFPICTIYSIYYIVCIIYIILIFPATCNAMYRKRLIFLHVECGYVLRVILFKHNTFNLYITTLSYKFTRYIFHLDTCITRYLFTFTLIYVVYTEWVQKNKIKFMINLQHYSSTRLSLIDNLYIPA